ncbi:DNA-processing protein DprA [Thermotoga sp. SG1]|uniref:DNA-processing protein DprA n=1 Tax=Thermotoga sp. SG1 TaxID=126739 RepID=UPI000C780AF7|nr:DNA-processing protein DprA [Thermotoga sp. SG1]PLV57477.1 DNA processing protein DprA [Thermotoga sp. SG1]
MTPLEIALLVYHGGYRFSELEPHLELKAFLEHSDPKKAQKFRERCNEEEFERQKFLIEKYDVRLISFWDDSYPESLRKSKFPPVVLFVRGDDSLLRKSCVGVVGTRKPTGYGISVTRRFVGLLCERFVIVSGMALGIDSVAHREALERGGKTVAVLGTGVDVIYPKSNKDLFIRILESGCVVSEYPMGIRPQKYHFPARNRIIAGLSKAIIVTEAPVRSGALITAKFAVENGRDVFAVPGDIDRSTSEGTNYLVKSGAYPLTDEEDLRLYFGIASKKDLSLDPAQKMVFESLKVSPKSVDELIEELKWDVSEVLRVISELELMGLVEFTGGTYRTLG